MVLLSMFVCVGSEGVVGVCDGKRIGSLAPGAGLAVGRVVQRFRDGISRCNDFLSGEVVCPLLLWDRYFWW